MPRTPSTHSSSNAAPVRTAQRVRPPRSGGAGGCDADRRDDGWGPYGTPPDHAAAVRLAALRAAAGHVAGLGAAGPAQTPAENDEAAAQEEHFKAHFALHAAQWAPQSLAALQAGAERAAAKRAAAASSTQGSQDHEYAYVSGSDSD